MFMNCLKQGQISTTNIAVQAVIAKIRSKFPMHLLAAAGNVDACVDLYRDVKALPATFTKAAILHDLNMSVNGPYLGFTMILTAIDLTSGRIYLIKLLRSPQFNRAIPGSAMRNAVDAEITACRTFSDAKIEGLVDCEDIIIDVEHGRGIDVSPGTWQGLKMRHYHSNLTQLPKLSERLLYRGFLRIKTALEAIHSMGFVHMDVKSDNIFVDEDGNWYLGDFGSVCSTDSANWTYTEVLNPYQLTQFITQAIPSMDLVSLCVMIVVCLDTETWKERLCDTTSTGSQRVEYGRISKSFSEIEDISFKNELTDLFEINYSLVVAKLIVTE